MMFPNFEDKNVDNEEYKGGKNHLTNGQNSRGPDQKLLQGTVQFYEDVLKSLQEMYIAIISDTGRHMEAWGNPNLESEFGISHLKIKGSLLEDVFDRNSAGLIKTRINDVLHTGEPVTFRFRNLFPLGTFWIEGSIAPLTGTGEQKPFVVASFRNVTAGVENEIKLNQYRDKFKHVFDHEREIMIMTNHKGIVTFVNPSFKKITGFSDNEILGFKLIRIPLISYKTSHYFQVLLDGMQENRPLADFEFEWFTASGLSRWSEVHTEYIHTHDRVTGLQVRFFDITERKLVERDLLKSKQAYKVIIENAHEAIFILQEGSVVFCNSKLLDLLNISMDELLNRQISGYIHPDDLRGFESDLAESKGRGNAAKPMVFRFANVYNTSRWMEAKCIPFDWNNQPALLIYARDVTDQMALVEKEKSSQSHIRFLYEKAREFAEFDDTRNIYRFISRNILEAEGVSAVLVISYDQVSNFPKVEQVDGKPDVRESLQGIISNNLNDFSVKINHELIKNLSVGKLIKYNDGLFEQGNYLFPKNMLNVIRQTLDIGDIYLIGFKHLDRVYGSAMMFFEEGKKPVRQDTLEIIGQLASAALHRKNQREVLAASEQKYRHIFESSQDIYIRADIDGSISEISPSVTKISGYDPTEIKGKFIRNFFADRTKIFSYTRALFRDGVITDKDVSLRKKNGEIFFASINARLLYNDQGTVSGMEGFIRDISERRTMEEQFQRSEEKFRTLADFTYDWEYWTSPAGELIYMSPSCERISGYPRQAFYRDTKLLRKILHEEDVRLYDHHVDVEEKENKRDVLRLNYRIVHKDGEIRWINHICQEVYSEKGKSLGRRVSNRDITERKLAEDELRNSETRFRMLFYESPDAIFVLDYDGVILDVNPAACRMQQLEATELTGKNLVALVPAGHRDELMNEFPKWITGETTHYRGILVNSVKREIPVEIHGSKINVAGRKALMFIIRDITEVVEKENQLLKSVERAEEADMMKSAFLANVSHEIRTPMNAIIGFSEILSNPDLSQAEREEFINYITQGGNTLMTLIEDIIDITKIEAGQIKINFADCDVNDLLDELYATFLKLKNKSGRTDVELRMNKPLVEEKLVISTDPYRIRQILSNLLGNAVKFTREGYIEIGCNIDESQNVVFYVKDTGIGIPTDKLDFIFERFGQVNDPRTSEVKGTGLGLSISKRLAGLLGGELTVESVENQGSVFYLTLPTRKEIIREKPTEKKPKELHYDWSDKTFLIAEDSILNFTFLDALFQRTKVKILWAKNGQEAVDMCQENEAIDLVLMDIKMPVLDGLEAIAEIKRFRPDLPIIVQTAYAMPEDRERSLAAGGDEYLTKPINVNELFGTISRFLN